MAKKEKATKTTDKILDNSTDESEIASKIVERFKKAETAQDSLFKKFDRFYKAYRCYVKDSIYPWRSKVFDPVVFYAIETLIPQVMNRDPKLLALPREESDIEKAKVVEELLDYQWNNPAFEDSMYVRLSRFLREVFICGTSVAKIPWKYQQRLVKGREYQTDTVSGESLGHKESMKNKVIFDDPNFEHIDIFDFFIDPLAETLDNARYIIHRKYVTLSELEESNKGRGVEVYKNLDQLKGKEGSYDDSTYKINRLDVIGTNNSYAQTSKDGKIEILEYWENDKVCTIANKSVVIRLQPNPFWHGKKPFVVMVDHAQPHSFWGVGEIEPVEREQHAINDLINQRLDNVSLILNGMNIVSRIANIDEDELVSQPGGIIHTNDINGIRPLIIPNITSLQESEQLRASIERTLGVSGYSAGTPQASSDQTRGTATGILAIQKAAATRYGHKLHIFEEMVIKRIGQFWIELDQQFIEEDRVIRIVGKGGNIEFKQIKRDDIQGDFDVVPEAGSTEPLDKEAQRQRFAAFMAQVAKMPPDQVKINWQAVVKEMGEEFDIKNVDDLVEFPEPQPALPPEMGTEGLPQEGQQVNQSPMPPQAMQQIPNNLIGG